MDVEAVSKVNANYSASESTKVVSPSVEVSDVAASAEQVKVMASKSVTSSANAKDGRSGEAEEESRKKHVPSEATINDAVKSANRKMEKTRCEYSYHKETNRVSIKVFDADTDEVIREIPPDKSLDMLQKMWEMAGILVDEKR